MSEEKDEVFELPAEALPGDAEEGSELSETDRKIADLERQIAEERAARQTVEANANEAVTSARRQAEQETAQRIAATETAISRAVDAAEVELQAVKEAHLAALQNGEFEKATELADQIANSRTKLNAARWEQEHFARNKAAEEANVRKASETAPADPQPQFSDPADAIISAIQAPNSRRWLSEHRDVARKMATDARFAAKVTALDNAAFAEGIDRDSPEYFSYIEEGLGMRQKSNPGTAVGPRGASTSRVTESRTIRLDDVSKRVANNPRLAAAAKVSFPSLSETDAYKQYARGLVLEKKRDPSFMPEFKL